MKSFLFRFSIIIGFVTIFLFVGCAPVPVKSTLLEGDIGKVEFQSLKIDENSFLKGLKQGDPVIISGELRIPEKQGKVLAVILAHGGGGIRETEKGWVKELNNLGYATFLVDSFSGRNITNTLKGHGSISTGSTVIDLYRALELLKSHPRIDSSKICVMGFSRGGRAVLWAAMKRFQNIWLSPDCSFAAYLSFYPAILEELQNQADIGDGSLCIFQGVADDITPVQKAQDYISELRKFGKEAKIIEYPDAYHSFDDRSLPKHLKIPKIQNLTKCRFVEISIGKIIQKDTGEPFSDSASCYSNGGTIGYNSNAHLQAVKDVKEFLKTIAE
jgi:dienelactone hydrolase